MISSGAFQKMHELMQPVAKQSACKVIGARLITQCRQMLCRGNHGQLQKNWVIEHLKMCYCKFVSWKKELKKITWNRYWNYGFYFCMITTRSTL